MFNSLEETKIPGCFLIKPRIFKDERGVFIKTFHKECYKKMGLRVDFKEEYYSVSQPGVIRGLHFQLPPHDHAKLVYCTSGEAIDVVVDLRRGSPTYGDSYMSHLTAEKGEMLYIPSGLAHGFCALDSGVTMMYKVTSAYSAEHDAGVRWDSVGISWPLEKVILSERDRKLPSFADFESPFHFSTGACDV